MDNPNLVCYLFSSQLDVHTRIIIRMYFCVCQTVIMIQKVNIEIMEEAIKEDASSYVKLSGGMKLSIPANTM